MGEGTNKELSSKQKIAIIAGAIALFIGTTAGMACVFHKIGADPSVSVGSGIVSGAFVVWIILSVTGILKEFSIKTPLVEMTSKLEEKITDVKKETEKVQNNLNFVSQKIDTMMMNISNNIAKAEVKNIEHYYESKGELKATLEDSGISSNKIDPDKSIPQKYFEKLDELIIKTNTIEQFLGKQSVMNIDELMQKANYYYYKKKFQQAISIYDEVLTKEPENTTALFNKAYSLTHLNRFEEGLACYNQVIALRPNDWILVLNKGAALAELGRYEEAKICFDAIPKNYPRYEIVLNNKANLLVDTGQFEESLLIFDEALNLNPKYLASLCGKGEALSELGRYEEAIHWFDETLKIEPNYVPALAGKAYSLDLLGKHDDARKLYEQANEIDSDESDLLFRKTRTDVLHNNLDVLVQLQKLVDMKPRYKSKLKITKDYDRIKNDSKFQKIIET